MYTQSEQLGMCTLPNFNIQTRIRVNERILTATWESDEKNSL